jgi:hypothetical protein
MRCDLISENEKILIKKLKTLILNMQIEAKEVQKNCRLLTDENPNGALIDKENTIDILHGCGYGFNVKTEYYMDILSRCKFTREV